MIRRLVQQQHVRCGQQQPAQRHAALLAAGELADGRLPGRQTQGVRGDLQLALQLPAAGGVDGILQLRLAGEQCIHLLIVHRLGELVGDLVVLLHLAEGLPDAFHYRGAHILGILELRLLRQEADADAALRARFPVKAGIHARHDLQQRGLARTVKAEHADLGARKERQADVAQDDALRGYHPRDAVHRIDVLSHAFSTVR
jgi:hypothetical protein